MRDQLLGALIGDSEDRAQDALSALTKSSLVEEEQLELVALVSAGLANNPLLAKRRQATRLRAVLTALAFPESSSPALAQAARKLPGHLRLAIADFLPSSAQHEVYRKEDPSTVGEPRSRSPSDQAEPEEPSSVANISDARPVARDRAVGPPSTVLLLSHPDHQEANRHQLLENDFDPVVVEDVAALDRILASNTRVCGFVIDESFLSPLDAGQQQTLFERISQYSTFSILRIHDSGLLLSHAEMTNVIKRARRLASYVPVHALSFQTDRLIRSAELGTFINAAELLHSDINLSFDLGDLSSEEIRLLAGAIVVRARAEHLGGSAAGGSAKLRFLPSGRSGARLVTIAYGDSRTFVAKVASKSEALDEILRFRSFVQEWDDSLNPECHFHGECGVILSTLVREGSDPFQPAQPLEAALTDLWNREWMGCTLAELEPAATFARQAVVRAAEQLADLNLRKPRDHDLSAYVDPPITHLRDLEASGFDYGLGAKATAARDKAGNRYRLMKGQAVVHGDIHLRNILLRGEADVQLIDFASSAPGHPAIDLVRLELALYHGPVRQFEDLDPAIEFQRLLSVDRVPVGVLRSSCPDFFRTKVNEVCAEGIVAARDHAIRVLEHHGGSFEDYLAAKLLVAWQNQGIVGLNPGLARAVIRAIVPEVESWDSSVRSD